MTTTMTTTHQPLQPTQIQHVKMTMAATEAAAAAAVVRDATRLEPLVCFHFFCYSYTFLGPL